MKEKYKQNILLVLLHYKIRYYNYLRFTNYQRDFYIIIPPFYARNLYVSIMNKWISWFSWKFMDLLFWFPAIQCVVYGVFQSHWFARKPQTLTEHASFILQNYTDKPFVAFTMHWEADECECIIPYTRFPRPISNSLLAYSFASLTAIYIPVFML